MTNDNKSLEGLKENAVQEEKEDKYQNSEGKLKAAEKKPVLSDEELREAKRKAVAEAKARAAKLKEQKQNIQKTVNNNTSPKESTQEITTSQELSQQQKQLQFITEKIYEQVGKSAIITASINEMSKKVPTIELESAHYYNVIKLLKTHSQLLFDSMHELHGTDYLDYFEVYVSLFSYKFKHTVVIKVKVDRENPMIHSIAELYPGANWPERETFDLLGIQFENHPNLKRILLPDDWVGYPLRKDYEAYDVEV